MDEESDEPVRPDDWYFVDLFGKRFRLPRTMLFIGREECDVLVKADSVDKRHAVITFDHYLDRFKIKDLSTVNKTYVNQSKIPEQEYVTLNHMDTVQLGHNSPIYHIEQGCSSQSGASSLPTSGSVVPTSEIMVTQPETDQKTQYQGLAEKAETSCNSYMYEDKHSFLDGPPKYIIPKLSQPVMFFAEITKVEKAIEPQINAAATSTNFFVPLDDKPSKNDQEFISSQVPEYLSSANKLSAVKPSVPKTYEYDVYLNQEGTSTTNSVSHVHGKIVLEECEIKKSTPLYGQPNWWGEDNIITSNTSNEKIEDENNKKLEAERPSSITQAMEKYTPATVFTIDFGEDKKVKTDLNLSDHIPSRIREKLESRKKTKSPESDSSKKIELKKKTKSPDSETPRRFEARRRTRSPDSDKDVSHVKGPKILSNGTSTKKQEIKKLSKSLDSDKNVSHTKVPKNLTNGTKKLDTRRRLNSSDSEKSTPSSKNQKTSINKTKKLDLRSKSKSFDSDTSPSQNNSQKNIAETPEAKGSQKRSVVKKKSPSNSPELQYKDGKSYLMEKMFEGTEIVQIPETNGTNKYDPNMLSPSTPEDNVSNSGTYTIDDDEEDNNEEEKARQRIDEVFGVVDISDHQLTYDYLRPVVNNELSTSNNNLSDGSTCTPTDDCKSQKSFNQQQYDNNDLTEVYDVHEYKMASVQDGEVPLWMSQLVALAHKNPGSTIRVSPPIEKAESTSSPSNNNSKKRPGTGRRLPAVPTRSSSSNTSSPLSESLTTFTEHKKLSPPSPIASSSSSSSKRSTLTNPPVMTSTRPNRAFELRRSNADSSIRKKSTSSNASTPPHMGLSASKPPTKPTIKSTTKLTPKPTLKSKTSNTTLSNLKRELKKTNMADPPKKGLAKSQSTPGSRNNSPKTMAFKRRMEYDPRKSVKEAKAKSNKAASQSSVSQQKSNLVRSSSCSNSEELCGLGSMKELSRSYMYKSAFSTPSPKDLSNTSPLQRSASLRSKRNALCSLDSQCHDSPCQQNGLHRAESYNPLLVSSIYQLSLQMKSQLEKTVDKLKDQEKISATPSPIDDFLEEPEKSRFPAWKSANNELISILKNLRRIKHQMQAVDSVLFPTPDQTIDQIHRLSREITEFHPISCPDEFSDEGSQSPDMMEEMFY